MENDLDLGLATCDVAAICHGDVEGTAQKAAEMSGGMCELVFFIVAIRQVHEYTEIMLTGTNANAGSCKLGADLVKATG